MIAPADTEVRTLIVVTRDHGEFGLAMSFLRGQHLARGATMLLPGRLHALHRGATGIPTRPYAGARDILAEVRAQKPHVVLLFSGYLLRTTGLLSRAALAGLLVQFQASGCRVATSDPFVGLAPALTLGDIDQYMLTSGQFPLRRWVTRAAMAVQGLRAPAVRAPGLQQTTHVYPTGTPTAPSEVSRAAFFNPATLQAPDEPGDRNAKPRWLFLLSATDFEVQSALHGRTRFLASLARTVWAAAKAGQAATLIAPASAIKVLQGGLPDVVELLPACPFAEFERRVLEAEYVFYWNAFSFSMVARLANLRPVFLFDRGHMARTIRPFYEAARAVHFGGWEPPYLDQEQPLDLHALAALARAQLPALQMLRSRWASHATPDQLIDRLLLEPPPTRR